VVLTPAVLAAVKRARQSVAAPATSDIMEHLQADEAFMSKPFATEDLGLKIREMLGRTTQRTNDLP
jgi:hypothetical protein